IILCSAVKRFREGKRESTFGEGSWSCQVCESIKRPGGLSSHVQPGHLPVSNNWHNDVHTSRLLASQGLLKLVRSQKGEQLFLKVDASDITFALQAHHLYVLDAHPALNGTQSSFIPQLSSVIISNSINVVSNWRIQHSSRSPNLKVQNHLA
ncbi:hypothetical protein SOVF_011610, partial [Spinacia oleracea]